MYGEYRSVAIGSRPILWMESGMASSFNAPGFRLLFRDFADPDSDLVIVERTLLPLARWNLKL